MARDLYQNTLALADGTGTLKALAGVQVYVYHPGTQDLANIYAAKTGAGQLANPVLSPASGLVEFYADAGEYDIRTVDTVVPARIADRTVPWSAVPMAVGGIPSSRIAADAGIPVGALGADVLRQVIPIGQVIDWWRPSSAVPLPAGFEICDGRSVATHDFGIAGAVTLPDLRNKFVIGADPVKADGSISNNGDGTAAVGAQHPNAPGIGGIGGANSAKDLRHSHQFAHTHGVPGVSHAHEAGSLKSQSHAHGIDFYSGTADASITFNPAYNSNNLPVTMSIPSHGHGIIGTSQGSGEMDVYGNAQSQTPASTTTNSQSTSTTDNGTAAATADMRPAHVGLLKLMKCRRA